MNLGLAAVAGNAYFDQTRRLQQFDHEQALRDAERTLIPDRTAAARAGYQDQVETAEQRRRLRPGATSNDLKRQGLDAVDLDARAERQPQENQTRQNRGTLELRQSESALETQPLQQGLERDKLQIDRQLMDLTIEQLPRVMAQKRREGALSDQQAGVLGLSKLSDLISLGDPKAVIKFMNDMAAANGGAGAGLGVASGTVADVGIQTDPSTGEKSFVAKDAAGKTILSVTRAQMQRARQLAGADGKTELKTVNAGDTLVGVQGGKATPLFTAPESEKSKANRSGPLERDVAYLTSAHGMSKEQALQHLQSAKSMSRQQFILKSISDAQAMGKRVGEAEIAELGALYDRTAQKQQGTEAGGGQGSNNPGARPMPSDPAIRQLLGIP